MKRQSNRIRAGGPVERRMHAFELADPFIEGTATPTTRTTDLRKLSRHQMARFARGLLGSAAFWAIVCSSPLAGSEEPQAPLSCTVHLSDVSAGNCPATAIIGKAKVLDVNGAVMIGKVVTVKATFSDGSIAVDTCTTAAPSGICNWSIATVGKPSGDVSLSGTADDGCLDAAAVSSIAGITSIVALNPPGPVTRTTIGIGELVTCLFSTGEVVDWSANGQGSVNPPSGVQTVLTASKTPGACTVKAKKQNGSECTLTFDVIAPNAIRYGVDFANAGGYPLIAGPPDNRIGNGRTFLVTILPTTVSFMNVDFRESAAAQNFVWPRPGSVGLFPAEFGEFHVNAANEQTDRVSIADAPIENLNDGTGNVDFTATQKIPLDYKNAAGQWINFVAGDNNRHLFIFAPSGTCKVKCIGENEKESVPRGPWQ